MCPLCYLLSLFMILGTFLKPAFFWRSEQVLRVRRWLGDRGAHLFYYGIGGSLLAIGTIFLVR